MKVVAALYLFFVALALAYLALPNPAFPDPPPDAVRSTEPADSETEERRAYFTNYDRAEVMAHYRAQFAKLPTLSLNHPPEDAQSLIRDQTRSSYLEELAHPLRESVYINGFKPTEAKDEIWYKGEHFEQKITVRYAQSSLSFRIVILLSASALLFVLSREWLYTIATVRVNLRPNK